MASIMQELKDNNCAIIAQGSFGSITKEDMQPEDRLLVTVHLYHESEGPRQYMEYYVVPVKDDRLRAILHEIVSMTKRQEAVGEWKEMGYMFWEGDIDQVVMCDTPKGVLVSGFCDMIVYDRTSRGVPWLNVGAF